jgi:tRNA-modifying protein YgfZ
MPDHAVSIVLQGHGVLAVEGEDRLAFLQGLLTNNVTHLSQTRALYAALLAPQGKVLFDFFLALEGETILIDVARSEADALLKRLALYKLRAKVALSDRSEDYAVIALVGADAATHLKLEQSPGAAGRFHDAVAFVDPRHAGLGARLIVRREKAEALISAIGLPTAEVLAYDELRMRLGIAEGAEISREGLYPLEANFEALNGVDFKKGCYVGQELTARMKHKTELRKRLLPVLAETALPEPGEAILAGAVTIGTLIGCAHGKGVALIRLDRWAQAQGTIPTAGGIPLKIERPSWLTK